MKERRTAQRLSCAVIALAFAFAQRSSAAPAVASADESALPKSAVFAFPNPARYSTTIRFEAADDVLDVKVRIFTVSGRPVREFRGHEITRPKPGLRHAKWNLKNAAGSDVAPGVYLFFVEVRDAAGRTHRVIKKLAVIR